MQETNSPGQDASAVWAPLLLSAIAVATGLWVASEDQVSGAAQSVAWPSGAVVGALVAGFKIWRRGKGPDVGVLIFVTIGVGVFTAIFLRAGSAGFVYGMSLLASGLFIFGVYNLREKRKRG